MKRFLIFVALIVLAVFLISQWNRHRPVPEAFTPAAAPTVNLKEIEILAALDEANTRLVEAVLPSVVSLTTRRMQERRADPFEFFFGRRGRALPREMVPSSLGSGVIVSKEGHILTNNHVVANMDEVKVHLRDGREFPAKVIGTDEVNDIAVLKISADGLVPLPLGDSDKVRAGSMVFAIGNPFGLQESVTQGIISATRRQMSDESPEFFQTDTAINPGNSGGPLVNLSGEIIGINTAIGNYSGSGTWQGVGFAIPSNTARRSLESILKAGRVVRGYLGVAMQELTPELADQLGLPRTQTGALVIGVAPGSPAEAAGVQRGDIITSFNGKEIRSIRDLFRQVSATPVGTTVSIELLRGAKQEKVSATIQEQPDGFRSFQPQQPPPSPKGQEQQQQPQGELTPDNPLYGLKTMPIPDARRAELPPNVRGVMIAEVAPAAPAGDVLQPGDVVEEIGGQPVASPAEFERLAASILPQQRVVISIVRGKVRSFVVIP